MGRAGSVAPVEPLRRSAYEVTVREAEASDIPALAGLKRQVAERAYSHAHGGAALIRWLDEHCGEAFFRYRVGRKDYHVFVAADANGQVIGVGGYRKRGVRADGSSVGLYVAEQGHGIGRLLNDAREQHARANGCTRARVSCWRTNQAARAFVERLGYRRTGSGYREQTTGVMVDHYERELA